MPQEQSLVTRLARVGFGIALPVVLLFSPLYLLVSRAFVRHEYGLSHIPSSVRFGQEERLALSDVMIGYLRGWNTAEEMAALITSEGIPALDAREFSHMVDVKQVMDGFFGAQRVALGLIVLSGVWLLFRSGVADLGRLLQAGVYVAGALILVVVAFSLLDFNTFFTVFHRLLFEDGTWTFWETDTLIQLYPLPFWVDAVWKLGATILVELGVVYALGAWLQKQEPAASAAGQDARSGE